MVIATRTSSISVCLCTYNGERYLEELLASLASQTVAPIELLVGDDGSSDRTLGIVRDFATTSPFPVAVIERPVRLGPAGNLEALIRAASGELIFPCDQDDVWRPEKLAVVSETLAAQPGKLGAVHDSALLGEDGSLLPGSLFALKQLSADRRRAIENGTALSVIARQNVVASHALGMRREALELVLPMPPIRHADWWIGLLLAATSGLAVIDDRLVSYRQHGTNVVGLDRTMLERSYAEATAILTDRAEMLEAVLARLDERRPGAVGAADRTMLSSQVAHLRARAALPPSKARRIAPVIRELASGSYGRFASGWRTAAADLGRRGEGGATGARR